MVGWLVVWLMAAGVVVVVGVAVVSTCTSISYDASFTFAWSLLSFFPYTSLRFFQAGGFFFCLVSLKKRNFFPLLLGH